MSICLTCNGLVMEPGVAYGWAGKVCHCTTAPKFRLLPQEPMLAPCGCVGPQNGQPLCPCQMRGVQIKDGRYVRIQDLGPAP